MVSENKCLTILKAQKFSPMETSDSTGPGIRLNKSLTTSKSFLENARP